MDSKYTGFTLIELLVVMAIIGILAATAIVNFGKNEDRDVRAEKDRLTSFLREVQNKALAGDKVSGVSGKVCGFGVHYDATSKNLQAYYTNTSGLTAMDDACPAMTYDLSNKLEEFIPRNGVGITDPGEDIFFSAPTGEVFCNAVCTFPVAIPVTKGSSTGLDVKIDQSGRIY